MKDHATGSRRRWINAAIVLGNDPEAMVLCPVNFDDYLNVVDTAWPDDPNTVDRMLRCPTCGEWNEIRGVVLRAPEGS